MLTEIVLFDLPEDMSRDELVAKYRETAPGWREDPRLIRKAYLYDPARGQGGGVYLWPDAEAAHAAHDEAWRRRVVAPYGSEPTIRYFETPIVVDNELERIVDSPVS